MNIRTTARHITDEAVSHLDREAIRGGKPLTTQREVVAFSVERAVHAVYEHVNATETEKQKLRQLIERQNIAIESLRLENESLRWKPDTELRKAREQVARLAAEVNRLYAVAPDLMARAADAA